ncbi:MULTISPECIES: GAF and ANTAR domain-containing protein [Streptomyces rochei group]|uniref:GAF and ANTAR domain-containing protein n=1 Tax=Streptomyces vinaceusdrappus TaxID=67376 RepID=A0ABY6BV65_9ACTN|nr:GAF and ANTAR domain-containing protein [Streptomyces vinaceusdrappus]MDV6289218.1 GAF and ANTAR domain-containing protein [Streptomyces sp. UP1A-1]UXI79584.1 GAF and ANTAR domain-containing protein [Streptomyces vinaceusdrappus]
MTSETSDTLDQAMARSQGLDTLLRDLTDRAVGRVPGAAACSVTVRRADRLMTLAGSSGLPSGLDLRQYENGSGPCVDAAETGSPRYSADLAEETRWPAYTEYALATGVRCVLALPLAIDGETGAALNFYGLRPHCLADGREEARVFAERAADAVNEALRVERRQASAADVRTALLSRSVIDQAVGILMARERIDAHLAMERLRRASQHTNVKLRDLCDELVARASGGASRRRQ